MAVTLKQLIDAVEKAKKEAKPEDMDKVVKLNVANARWINDVQSGEWGTTPDLEVFQLSVCGGASLMIFGG